ncbi:MAG: MBL fold metallo-hydrolase [Elusimicrobia bacterium]|nr:MBL fold metallo-hydrolase [Elusimicrobiota bacterium]
MAPPLESPPAPTEIEISLFGPAFGESLVIHIGQGKWIIVDSCIGPGPEKYPIPLAYLKTLNVDVGSKVELVIASHWHDDHIRGLAQVLEESKIASFACPAVMAGKEFLSLKELYEHSDVRHNSGINEYTRIFNILSARGTHAQRALASSRLLNSVAGKEGSFFNVELWALSPTHAAMDAYIKQLVKPITEQGPQRRITNLKPNDTAMVLQLIAGADSALLGSDMENHGASGWGFILDAPGRPPQMSSSYKVAHHGSASGDHPITWSGLLNPQPFAFVTPFHNGRVRLPTAADIARIKGLTDKSYITAVPPRELKSRSLPRSVQRTIDQNLVKIWTSYSSSGHIRFRFTPGTPMTREVSLFRGATKL